MTKIVLCFYYNRMKCTDDNKRKKSYRNTLYLREVQKLQHKSNYPICIIDKILPNISRTAKLI